MRSAEIFYTHNLTAIHEPAAAANGAKTEFAKVLNAKTDSASNPMVTAEAKPLGAQAVLLHPASAAKPATVSVPGAAAAYQKQTKPASPAETSPDAMSGWQKYKEDQLLRHPGSDHFQQQTDGTTVKVKPAEGFWDRIKKDLSDAELNFKNFFADMFSGAKISYRDENNQIKTTQRRGVLGAVGDFFKDLGSALSFGAWRPDGEPKPEGLLQTAKFVVTKVGEAVLGDMINGVAKGVVHMGKDLVLAGWNLLEVVPDATIGNFEAGRKATTAVFDNGQVVLDYVTDVLPAGDAWTRVHTSDLKNLKLPVQNNLQKAERTPEDKSWQHVRNTPFRKTIETIGAFFFDLVSLNFFTRTLPFGRSRNGPQ
jgi:hypothetical protein